MTPPNKYRHLPGYRQEGGVDMSTPYKGICTHLQKGIILSGATNGCGVEESTH